MKLTVLKLYTLLLLALASTLILGAPRTAEACLPPEDGIFVYGSIDFEQSVPLNGAWAFRASVRNASVDELSVEVRDENDQLVEGTLSHILESERDEAAFEPTSEFIVVWTPTELLLPNHLYSAHVSAHETGLSMVDKHTTFRSTTSEAVYPEAASIAEEPSLSITEKRGADECCYDPSREGYCGEKPYTCWPTAYVYQPTINIEFQRSANDTNLQTYQRLENRDGDSKIYWTTADRIGGNWYFSQYAASPYCVLLKTYALATHELLEEIDTCFGQDDFPAYTERELNNVTRPDVCDDEPDTHTHDEPDTTDSDASGEDATSHPDTHDEPDTTESDDFDAGGCGCSSNPTSPSSLLGMLLLFFGLAVPRLSLFSRNG